MRNIRRARKQTYFRLWMPETRAQHARRVRAGRTFDRDQVESSALNRKSLCGS